MVCSGPNCGRTSDRIAEEFEVQIKIAGLRQEIQVIRGSCMGLCSSGPNVIMFPEGTIYSHVQIQDAARIVNEHLLKGNRVEELLYDETKVTNTTRGLDQTEFFQRQTRVALRNCGVIDPQNIEEYIAVDGYAALYKVLTEMSPDEVIDTVLESGLQGRGGAGFPTGMKWKFASGNRGQVQKYVCCNADEGDPGAFMDRSILEGNPHTVIEAMAIAAYAIGADKGYIYVRAEYPVAIYVESTYVNNYLINIVVSLGGDIKRMGTLLTVSAMSELPTMLLFSRLVGKWDSRKLIRFAAVMFSVKALGYLVCGSISFLYVVQMLQMLSFALCLPSAVYYVNETMAVEDRVKGQSLLIASSTMGGVFGSLSGGVLVDFAGIKAMLATGLGLSMIGTAIVCIFVSRKDN